MMSPRLTACQWPYLVGCPFPASLSFLRMAPWPRYYIQQYVRYVRRRSIINNLSPSPKWIRAALVNVKSYQALINLWHYFWRGLVYSKIGDPLSAARSICRALEISGKGSRISPHYRMMAKESDYIQANLSCYCLNAVLYSDIYRDGVVNLALLSKFKIAAGSFYCFCWNKPIH